MKLHKISIGLPVYNGEKYLTDAIESILSQTYEDIELIICDNASTDGTRDICEEFKKYDNRIKYKRNHNNIGAANNFNLAFRYAQGKYFRWMAHDDICAPTYLEECEKVLTQDDSIILCHSDVRFIDEKSDIIYNDYKPLSFANSKYPSKRFKELIDLKHWCIDIFGLIRKEALNQTSLIQNFVGSDRNLLVELGLIGRFYRIPEELFYHREHIDRSTHTKTIHDRIEWWSPELSKRYHMPHWQMFLKNFKSIKMFSNLPIEPLKCYLALLDWLLKYWRKLYWDVKVVTRNTLQNL